MSSTISQAPTHESSSDQAGAYDLRPSDDSPQPERRSFWRSFLDEVKGSRYHCLLYTSPSPRDRS